MQPQSPPAFDRRQTRIVLLRELILSLQQAQRAIVLADLKGMEKHLTTQHKLCLELLALGDSREETISADAGACLCSRWNELTQDLREAERRAHHLGRVQAALLRRCRRAQELMARLLATSAVTYLPPFTQAAAAGK